MCLKKFLIFPNTDKYYLQLNNTKENIILERMLIRNFFFFLNNSLRNISILSLQSKKRRSRNTPQKLFAPTIPLL